MSLVKITLEVLSQIMTALGSDTTDNESKRKVVSLGYPDILVNKSDIAGVFGDEFVKELQFREDSDAILFFVALLRSFYRQLSFF